jgi:APA family basic amino acid/polyamine antiporter
MAPSSVDSNTQLARRLGLFDATMIVMGGIIGSGIFINPYVVARQVHTTFLILGVWVFGGLLALIAAFIWAELAGWRPDVGGQYAYLREAFHPAVAFLYGWVLLLVIQQAAWRPLLLPSPVIFLRWLIGRSAIQCWRQSYSHVLTIINCLGVRAGSTVQSIFMVLKIVAIVILVVSGLFLISPNPSASSAPGILDRPVSLDLLTAIGAAMVPVLFAYGGWQTATFVAGEIKDPARNLSRGLVFGVVGVILLYLAANVVYLRVLGTEGLAMATAPASQVMKNLGPTGVRIIATGIAISTLGFLSQSMLDCTARLFCNGARWFVLQTSGDRSSTNSRADRRDCATRSARDPHQFLGTLRTDSELCCIHGLHLFRTHRMLHFCFRKRERLPANATRTPGHPFTTLLFVAACWLVVINTIIRYPSNTLIGIAILAAGVPAYFFWSKRSRN